MAEFKVGLIVEGQNDERRLKQAIRMPAKYVILGGTRYNNKIAKMIQDAIDSCEVVFVMTDPDPAGDWIAGEIIKRHPELTRIVPDHRRCRFWRTKGWKYGVEYGGHAYLRKLVRERYNLWLQEKEERRKRRLAKFQNILNG